MYKYYKELEESLYYKLYKAFSDEVLIENVPNRYFINPYGVLYNCMSKDAHKEANMIDPFERLKNFIFGNNAQVLSFGYWTITDEEMFYNDLYKLKYDHFLLEQYALFKGAYQELAFRYLHQKVVEPSDTLEMLLKGIISSEIALYKKIEEEKDNPYIKEILTRVISDCRNDLPDILVRYFAFHKIESCDSKGITTSSYRYGDFLEYFKRGYHLNVITGSFREPTLYFNSLDHFLDKNPEYQRQIKLLM